MGGPEIRGELFSVKYVSAMVSGHARRITDPKQMRAIFDRYTQRFAGSQTAAKQHETINGSIGAVALWEVTIDKITGKAKTSKTFLDAMKR